MTRQNIYDDLRFSQGYTKLRASGLGLNEQLEHPAIDSLLPSLWGVDLLDIGCGDGSRTVDYVRRGARSAIGVDPSQRMLASAVKHDRVDYQRAFIEDLRYEDNSFDLVVASMSLHYVEDIPAVLGRIGRWLRNGGSLLASVEHPIVSCRANHDWCEHGDHWPVDQYGEEGRRQTTWFVEDVIKYHRTVASWINAVLDAGLSLTGLLEPVAQASGKLRSESLRRPPLLVLKGTRAK